eukprot:53810_1
MAPKVPNMAPPPPPPTVELPEIVVKKKMELMKKEYVFKNINYCNNNIVCLDEEFNDVIFDLPDGNKELMDKIKNMSKEGQDKKKDVKIVV